MIEALVLPFAAVFALALVWFLISSPPAESDLTETGAAFQSRLRVAGIVILVAGMAAMVLISRTVGSGPEPLRNDVRYDIIQGKPVPVMPGTYKGDTADMVNWGGNAVVVIFNSRVWFEEQWRGRNLARTVGILSVAGFLACFYWARALDHPARVEDPPAG
jgi:protein-S-isoprenylcysteine O-methyltransferase Ste14